MQPGSFLHMSWECPNVFAFWRHLCSTLSGMLEVNIPLSPTLLLLNDGSDLEVSLQQRHLSPAALTAAKKTLALRWPPPHTLTWQQWANSFLDVAVMKRPVARVHGAGQKTLKAWDEAQSLVRERVPHMWILLVSLFFFFLSPCLNYIN